jgi:hypothetical protein
VSNKSKDKTSIGGVTIVYTGSSVLVVVAGKLIGISCNDIFH